MTTLRDLVRAFAEAMNLISGELEGHHEKTAFLSYYLADQMGLTDGSKNKAFYGGLFHDIGGVLTEKNLTIQDLEADAEELAKEGAVILKMFPSTEPFADVVLYSQSPWKKQKAKAFDGSDSAHIASIVHLADALAQILSQDAPVLNQLSAAQKTIHQCAAGEFAPEAVAAFDSLCSLEAVWMDALYHPDEFQCLVPAYHGIGIEKLTELTGFVSKIIDFRSPFTAMHSAGVAESAVLLATKAGMSEEECARMRIAGYLHDIGKLRVPREILEKPGKLTDEEFNIMKEHAYYSFRILSRISGFEDISAWAALHHEKLDGNGYPFHLGKAKLPLGSRIMAVADIFSATTEDRPYRKGMDKERVISILREDVEKGKLSQEIVELLVMHYDEIDAYRDHASKAASVKYQETLQRRTSL